MTPLFTPTVNAANTSESRQGVDTAATQHSHDIRSVTGDV
jgi:hypothetical protein